MWVPLTALFERVISSRQRAVGGVSAGKTKAQQVPVQIAHTMLALQKKRFRTKAAWNIARAALTKQGYVKPPFRERTKVTDVRPTQKGVRRGMKHAMEPDAPSKFKDFSKMFREIEPKV